MRSILGFAKQLSLIALVYTLTGCAVTSTYVSSIGARSVHGRTIIPTDNKEFAVPLIDSNRSLPGMAIAHGAALPYISLSPEPQGEPAGSVTINLTEVLWRSSQEGEISLLHEGAPKRFVVYKYSYGGKNEIVLQNDYRRWYGYPAQTLLVATIPIDVAIDVVAVGGALVVMPIVLGVEAVKGKSSTHTQKADAPVENHEPSLQPNANP